MIGGIVALGISIWLAPTVEQIVSWDDDCAVVVWDESIQLCYSEGTGGEESAMCSEFRTYGVE